MTAASGGKLLWPPLVLAWAILAIVFLPQALLLNLARPEPLPVWQAGLRSTAIFLLWAGLTPLALSAVRRWPPLGRTRWRNALVLTGVGIALCALHLLGMALVTLAMAPGPVPAQRLLSSLAVGLGATNVLMAGALFAVGIAVHQFAARRAAERQLSDARLAALRHQLQPHFLFNTLNALSELVHRDADRAESVLLRLSALLRRALQDGQAPRITLGEELDFLDDYLSIQETLLGERLQVRRRISRECLSARVPPLLLQPLVENALRHGIAPCLEGGVLTIGCRMIDGALCIDISDTGLGASLPLRSGIGMANTRERLDTEYAGAASVEVRTAPGEGFCVRLRLPGP